MYQFSLIVLISALFVEYLVVDSLVHFIGRSFKFKLPVYKEYIVFFFKERKKRFGGPNQSKRSWMGFCSGPCSYSISYPFRARLTSSPFGSFFWVTFGEQGTNAFSWKHMPFSESSPNCYAILASYFQKEKGFLDIARLFKKPMITYIYISIL